MKAVTMWMRTYRAAKALRGLCQVGGCNRKRGKRRDGRPATMCRKHLAEHRDAARQRRAA